MKKDDLRSLDSAAMESKLAEMAEQNFRIRFQMSMGQPEGLKKARENRKARARLLTYMREKELAAATASTKPGDKK